MSRPNFLFIITDQHRADFLGCYGHPVLRTPNIDGIAARGTRFEQFHVASPVCMPNRASLLTGRYPSVHGLRDNGNVLSWRARTFVDALAGAGYHTACIGKSHVQPMTARPSQGHAVDAATRLLDESWRDDGGDYMQEQPHHFDSDRLHRFKTPYYGFQEVDLVTMHGDQAAGHYLQWLRSQRVDADALRDHQQQLAHNYVCPQAYRTRVPENLYSTSYIRDKAIGYLCARRDQDQPFFAFVSFPDPHHPFTPPGHYWSLYDPSDFEPALPFEAHHNPPPPLAWSHRQMTEGRRPQGPHDSFSASRREIQEAMALTCGMISMIDDAVGAILQALRQSGRADDTIVVFTSDHGDYLGDFGLMLKGALALRSINRVPFIWSDPQRPHVETSHALASTIDIAPTVLARAGVAPYFGIQGRSLIDVLERGGDVRAALLIEYQDSRSRQGFEQPAMVRTIVDQRHRMSIYGGQSWGELYDYEDDPDECINRWEQDSHADVRARLMETLVQQMIDTVDRSPRARFAA